MDFDGYDWAPYYTDEQYAQQLYDSMVSSLAKNGVYPGEPTNWSAGVFVQSITNTPGYNQPNERTVTLITYN